MAVDLNKLLDLETPILKAYEIPRSDYQSLLAIVSIWRQIATERRSEMIFKDSECALLMLSCGFYSTDPSFQMFVCKDLKGAPQGFMRTFDNGYFLEIMAVAANPINIGFEQNKQLRGAGCSLLAKAEEIARYRKKEGICLIALQSSLKFYKNKGFLVEASMTLELTKPLPEHCVEVPNVS